MHGCQCKLARGRALIDGATNGQSWCIAMPGQACASLLCACTVRDAYVDVCRARYGRQADSGEGWLR